MTIREENVFAQMFSMSTGILLLYPLLIILMVLLLSGEHHQIMEWYVL